MEYYMRRAPAGKGEMDSLNSKNNEPRRKQIRISHKAQTLTQPDGNIVSKHETSVFSHAKQGHTDSVPAPTTGYKFASEKQHGRLESYMEKESAVARDFRGEQSPGLLGAEASAINDKNHQYVQINMQREQSTAGPHVNALRSTLEDFASLCGGSESVLELDLETIAGSEFTTSPPVQTYQVQSPESKPTAKDTPMDAQKMASEPISPEPSSHEGKSKDYDDDSDSSYDEQTVDEDTLDDQTPVFDNSTSALDLASSDKMRATVGRPTTGGPVATLGPAAPAAQPPSQNNDSNDDGRMTDSMLEEMVKRKDWDGILASVIKYEQEALSVETDSRDMTMHGSDSESENESSSEESSSSYFSDTESLETDSFTYSSSYTSTTASSMQGETTESIDFRSEVEELLHTVIPEAIGTLDIMMHQFESHEPELIATLQRLKERKIKGLARAAVHKNRTSPIRRAQPAYLVGSWRSRIAGLPHGSPSAAIAAASVPRPASGRVSAQMLPSSEPIQPGAAQLRLKNDLAIGASGQDDYVPRHDSMSSSESTGFSFISSSETGSDSRRSGAISVFSGEGLASRWEGSR